jgi:hypothetical protein
MKKTRSKKSRDTVPFSYFMFNQNTVCEVNPITELANNGAEQLLHFD